MAKKPNVFENYFKNSLMGRGLNYLQDQQQRQQFGFVNEDGFIDAPRPSSSPVTSAGNMSSEGLADVRASGARPFAGSGITVDRSPVEDAPGYTSSINSIGNFIIRDPGGNIIYGSGNWVSDRDYQAYVKAKEAAKEEEVKPTAVEEKTDEITDLATTITSRGSGVSAGPAQDAAEEFKEKGRKSTIMTSAQGITDEPVTGMLGKDGAEADRAKKLRGKRSLLAG
jgi:hypothetical protein